MLPFARHWGYGEDPTLCLPLPPPRTGVRTERDRLKKVKLLVPGHRDNKNWSWIKNSRLTLKPLIFPPHRALSRLCVSEVPFAYGDLVGCGPESCEVGAEDIEWLEARRSFRRC